MIVDVIDWLNDHKEELAMGLGLGVILALGLATDIPQEEITHLGYFVLSLLIGNFTVANVTHQLHTPLISVTNAISGIIIIGGMLQLGGPLMSAKVTCALLAVFLSGINIVGGFMCTSKMLSYFSKSEGGEGGSANNVPDESGHH
jgi:NAD(P) transhydrogenase subunit alpha